MDQQESGTQGDEVLELYGELISVADGIWAHTITVPPVEVTRRDVEAVACPAEFEAAARLQFDPSGRKTNETGRR